MEDPDGQRLGTIRYFPGKPDTLNGRSEWSSVTYQGFTLKGGTEAEAQEDQTGVGVAGAEYVFINPCDVGKKAGRGGAGN